MYKLSRHTYYFHTSFVWKVKSSVARIMFVYFSLFFLYLVLLGVITIFSKKFDQRCFSRNSLTGNYNFESSWTANDIQCGPFFGLKKIEYFSNIVLTRQRQRMLETPRPARMWALHSFEQSNLERWFISSFSKRLFQIEALWGRVYFPQTFPLDLVKPKEGIQLKYSILTEQVQPSW